MREKATVPAIVLGVVAVIVVVYFLGKTFMAPPPTNTGKIVYPSFIDPSTGKPWAGHSGGSGETTPGPRSGGGPPGAGSMGSPPSGGPPSGGSFGGQGSGGPSGGGSYGGPGSGGPPGGN